MHGSGSESGGERPAVDERLVAPESRYEIIDGEVQYVAPADEPHGTRHAKVAAVLEAHVHDDFDVAVDMLTRTSEKNDIAPDASVFPRARHPETGGRQLEHLAFEVVSTQTLKNAGERARRLVGRGVRRVFAIDVERERLLEWSTPTDAWQMLPRRGTIEDACLAAPLPIDALVESTRADDAIARALLRRGNSVLGEALAERHAEGRAEGLADGVIALLEVRGLDLTDDLRARLRAERDPETLRRWLSAARTCATAEALFEA